MVQRSLYSNIGIILKRITGIKDFSLFRKNLRKKIGKIIYHKKYSAKDLVDLMCQMGMKKGSVVCIHSSMKEFYNYTGSAQELIQCILDVLGEEGTLIMPAYPPYSLMYEHSYIFDKDKDPTGAGYLAETFRKWPGVERSINVQHSVCALGKMARYLTKDHQNSDDCWDEKSPWQRLCELDGLVFNLGLPRNYIGTFHHCVESILKTEHPYWAQFFNVRKEFKYFDKNHNVVRYSSFCGELDRRTRKKKVTKFFDSSNWQIRKISNLEIKVFYSKSCLDKMLNLGRKGISVYYVPSPKKYKF